jgi:polysaccharide export outer membrane protein
MQKLFLSFSLFTAVALFVTASATAQAPSGSSPAASGLQQHPIEALRASQPPDADEYELGSGDEISVSVIGRPELSGPHIVGPDGRITMPMAGPVDIGGLSRDAAGRAISDALKNLYTSSVVTIQVTKYSSNKILLLGDVQHPGVMYFDGVPSLLEAVTRGGALLGNDKVQRMPTTCIIYRGKDQIGTVNLKEAFRAGDIRLHRGDIVYIPGDQERLVSVLGEVKNPGPIPLRDDSTLVSVLTEAGGITQSAGNPTIQIINPTTGTIQKVAFKDLLTVHGRDISMAVGNIIFVPRSGIANVGFFLQQISPAAQIGTIGSLLAR